MQKDPIISEVAQLYNLTYEQGLQMYDQYWLQYVVKRISDLEHENIYVENLGTYSVKLNRVNKEITKLQKVIGDLTSETLITRYTNLINKLQKLKTYVETSNTQKKHKRFYG